MSRRAAVATLLYTLAPIVGGGALVASPLWLRVAAWSVCGILLIAGTIVAVRGGSVDMPMSAAPAPTPASSFILGGSTDSTFTDIESDAEVFHAGHATRSRFSKIRHRPPRSRRVT